MNLQIEHKHYYTASEEPEIVEISEASYVSILGNGSPGTSIFYEKKKEIKKLLEELQNRYSETEKSFTSAVVEIFYWYDEQQTGFIDIGEFYTKADLDLLHYRIAVRIPDYVSDDEIRKAARASVTQRLADAFERFTYTAGRSVQVLHLGPLAGELETLPLLQEFATGQRLKKSGMHHELHLVNFERGESQAHLQTILRDPVSELTN